MKIRQALAWVVVLALTLALASVGLTQWYVSRIHHLAQVQRDASVVSHKVSVLQGLSQEAVLHNSSRVSYQWGLVQQDLVQDLQNLSAHLGPGHELSGLVNELMAVVASFAQQFSAITATDSSISAQVASARRETLAELQSLDMLRVSDGVFNVVNRLEQQRGALLAQQVQVLALVSLAFMVAVIGAVVFIYRRVLKPVAQLESVAAQVQGGNMQARNGLRTSDELGMLGQSFDRMTQVLQERERGLLQAKQDASWLYETLDRHSIVSVTDRHGTIIHTNAAFSKVSGYSGDELMGQDHRMVSSGLQTKAFWKDFWGTLNAGQTWRGEICNRARDGSLYWVDSMVVPMRNDAGELEKYIAIRNDITQRKASEAALRNSEAIFSTSFQSAAVGKGLLTPKGRFTEVNTALCEFLGYTPDEMKERAVADMTHPDDRASDAIQIPRLVLGEISVYQCAKRYVHRQGHTLWGLENVSVARDAHGLPLFLIVQIVDITARKRAEEALALSNALLEESQKIAKVGGWRLDVRSDHLYWTAETYRIHETTPEEFHPTLDVGVGYCLPDSRKQMKQALADAIQRGLPYDLELQTHTIKGSLIYVRTTGTPRVVDGRVVEISGIFQDITERKHYEQSLQEARTSAEQAAASKGQFLANMSHEIRTPMNAILGLLNLLQNTELTLRQRDYVVKTDGAAQSLLGLLNDILDFSKVEAGKMTLEHEPFRLDRLLRNLSVVLSANVGSKNIEVLYDLDPNVPDVVVGDAMRLQQVLVNLGGNAVKFTAQGQVVLSLRKLSGTAHSVTIECAVQDSGIGIAPEHQMHIFSGFSQAEGSTTRRFGGTGLGLAISKRFVELMGGEIRLVSTLGKGSTFSFVLNLGLVQDVPADLALPARPSLMPQRVLVVDDNPIAAELMLKMVRSWGWQAQWANSGAQALDMFAQAQDGAQAQTPEMSPGALAYSTVYMDWQMPQMDGWETTRRLRQWAAQHQLPEPTIIMVSAHGRAVLAQRSAAEQDLLNGFLVKPVTASMLYEALVDASTGSSHIRRLANGRSSARQLAGMRILVVEDNLINQQVAEELLSAQGAIVSLAANGRLGVEAVAAAQPQFDVVLMDIQMPVLDGYGATRTIRQELGLTQLPIIAMTANAMSSDRDACLVGGMDEHIGKPFDVVQLVSLLMRITGYRTTAPAAASASTFMPVHASIYLPGLDLGAALQRMSGNQTMYINAARAFTKDLGTLVPALRAHVQTPDSKAAHMLLHTLKDNAGTLGAKALATKAHALEVLFNTPQGLQQCAQELDALAAELLSAQRLLTQAATLLESATGGETLTAAGSAVAPKSDVLAALHALAALLAASDMVALQSFAELREALVQHFGPECEPLEDALQDLQFETANRLCMQLLSQ